MAKLSDAILRRHFRDLALRMALHCVRNTVIEDYHAAGKLNQEEMCALNHEVVDKIYSFLLLVFHPRYDKARANTLTWLYQHNGTSLSSTSHFWSCRRWSRRGALLGCPRTFSLVDKLREVTKPRHHLNDLVIASLVKGSKFLHHAPR